MYELKSQKNQLRSVYSERRRNLDRKEKMARDKKICDAFFSLVTYRYANTLLMYYPTEFEVDIRPIAERAIKDGKKIAFPRCNPSDRTMVFHYVTNIDEVNEMSGYKIPEPSDILPSFDPIVCENEKTACLIPALVYDDDGYRLGYGKGYYDRYLTKFYGTRVGIVYSDFTIEQVPRGKYDISVDLLVTEKGVKIINVG